MGDPHDAPDHLAPGKAEGLGEEPREEGVLGGGALGGASVGLALEEFAPVQAGVLPQRAEALGEALPDGDGLGGAGVVGRVWWGGVSVCV